MKLNDKVRATLAVVVTVGAFTLAGMAHWKGEVSLTAALAICLSALSSAGVLGAGAMSSTSSEE